MKKIINPLIWGMLPPQVRGTMRPTAMRWVATPPSVKEEECIKVGRDAYYYFGIRWNGSFHDAEYIPIAVAWVTGRRAGRLGRLNRAFAEMKQRLMSATKRDEVVDRFRLRDLVRSGD